MSARICVRARGPLLVEGDFELIGSDGKPIDLEGRKRVMLCRCGESSSRPICDGTHYRNGFEAPAQSEEEG